MPVCKLCNLSLDVVNAFRTEIRGTISAHSASRESFNFWSFSAFAFAEDEDAEAVAVAAIAAAEAAAAGGRAEDSLIDVGREAAGTASEAAVTAVRVTEPLF